MSSMFLDQILHNNLLIVLTLNFILQTRELSNQWHNIYMVLV